MNIFDIIGPVMIGPSSSHTAGAVRIGRVMRAIFEEEPKEAFIHLYGSFAKTYKGHGTDKAIAAGLLGFEVDDLRIRTSLEIAKEKGIGIHFEESGEECAHPNTVSIEVKAADGRSSAIVASSVGGGNIIVNQIDNITVEFTCEYYTVVIQHKDMPGVISAVTEILSAADINIAFMKVFRKLKGNDAIMVIETDQPVPKEVTGCIKNLKHVSGVRVIRPVVG